MKVLVTEYLRIDLESEQWECRRCGRVHGSARENYKKFVKIHARNPREIHRPILDPSRYEFNFSPDPEVCVIYEFYCPGCGTMIEVEYSVPGHIPMHDIELDVDALKIQWAGRDQMEVGGVAADPARSTGHRHHRHDHHAPVRK